MDLDRLKLIYDVPPEMYLEVSKKSLRKNREKHEQDSYKYNFIFRAQNDQLLLDKQAEIEELEESYEKYKRTGIGWC